MKYRNIIALCLGIFAAALLWQYYLWPKYQLKQETPEILALLDEAAQKELEDSIDYKEPGEILFIGEPVKEEAKQEFQPGIEYVTEVNKEAQEMAKTEGNDNQDSVSEWDDSNITMIEMPSEFVIIKDEASYKNFLSKNKGAYPKPDFKKEELAVVLSASDLADSFFEIVKAEQTAEEVKIFYRVNIFIAGKEDILKNYKIIAKTDLPVNFIQVK